MYLDAIPADSTLRIPVVNREWTTNDATAHPLQVEGSIYAAIAGPQGTGIPFERGVNATLTTGTVGFGNWEPKDMDCTTPPSS